MINYQRVLAAVNGELVSLTPRRAKEAGEDSPGMVLKFKAEDGEVIALDDRISKVIDDLAEQVEDED